MLKKSFAWLNKLVLAALLVTTLAPQALAVEIGQAPVISSVTATPNPYNPKDSSVNYGVVTISWNLNTTSNVWVEVYDGVKGAGGNKIADPMGPTNRNPGADSINWDGKHNGLYVNPGTYYYYVNATNLYASAPVVASGNFKVDYPSSPGTAPNITVTSVSPNPFNPDTQSTVFTYNLDKMADTVTLNINGSTYNSTTSNVGPGTGFTKSWNGRDNGGVAKVGAGTYNYELKACTAGLCNSATGTVTVNYSGSTNSAPNINTFYVTPTTFDPTSEQAKFVVGVDSVVDSLKVEVQINGTYTKVDTIKYNVSQGTFYWDGTDQFGDQVGDGTYNTRATASNSYGTDVSYGTVRVNSNGGSNNNNHQDSYGTLINNIRLDRSNIDTSNNERAALLFDVKRDGVKITVDILDSNDDVVRTLTSGTNYDTSVDNPVYWSGQDANGDGTYTFRIRATKSGYSSEVAYRDIDVNTNGGSNNDFQDDYGSLISNVSVDNDIFNPKQSERAKLLFDVEQNNVKVTVDILTLSKSSIRSLVSGTNYNTSNGNSVYWNGRNNSNTIQKDAVYVYRIRATKSGYPSEVGYRYVEVDTDGIIIGFPNTNNNGTSCAGFTDVSANNPYCKAIELMKLRGIFAGYSDGTFRPYAGISRAEVVKVVLLAIGLSVNNSDTRSSTYWDVVSGQWYVPFLNAATRYGIINGYPDGAFRPDIVPNKVELLKIFLRGTGINIPHCTAAPYSDTPSDAWYLDYVCFAVNNQLVYGDGTGKFNPATPMTRGDVAMLFYNFYVRGLASQINYGIYGYNSGYVPTTGLYGTPTYNGSSYYYY